VSIWNKLRLWSSRDVPLHLERGKLGESAAQDFLKKKGLKFLAANFAGQRGEIDLVFRDDDCLVFVEVKTRSDETWSRPSRAVDRAKRQALARTAQEYLRLLADPRVAYRFDIVEVLLENGEVREIRHLENAFNTANLWQHRSGRTRS